MAGVLLVRDVMTKDVKTVRIDSTVREAVHKMNKFDIGSVIVVDKERPVGIMTERDILRRIVEQSIDPSIVKVSEIMSKPLVTVNPDTSIEEAARIMAKKQIKKLPVVENDRLVGIVTSTDIMRASPKLLSLIEELLRTRTS